MSDAPITTALTERHRELGARLAPFAGWEMPIEFAGTIAEHTAVREQVGIFDVSHLGTVWLRGDGALDVISRTFTNDPRVLKDGTSQYTLCCDDDGGIIDDCIVYRLASDVWMLVPNASNTAAVVAEVEASAAKVRDAGGVVEVADESQGWAIIAIQGPDALETAAKVLPGDPALMDHLAVVTMRIAGNEAVLCRTGYTGEAGCELVIPNASAQHAWDALLGAGAVPIGLAARDTLRLEMGYALHGNDIDTSTNPYEARLGWAVKLDRDDFNGRDALLAIKAAGPKRRLFGLLGAGRRPLRAGLDVLSDGVIVGRTTSGTFSPTLGVGVGMGYLDDPIVATKAGPVVQVDVRGKPVDVTVVRPPFVTRDPKA